MLVQAGSERRGGCLLEAEVGRKAAIRPPRVTGRKR